MLIRNRTTYAVAAALVASLALAGCKKKEEPAPAPPAVAPLMERSDAVKSGFG